MTDPPSSPDPAGARLASVFLSHSQADKPFVRRLNDRLAAHGVLTWLDEAELQVGDSLLDRIQTAIRDFDYLGVVLSRHSVQSEWVRREVHMALTEEIRGRRIKVLPLLVEPCDIPGFLSDKAYADFTQGFEQGLAALLRRLGHGVGERDASGAARNLLARQYREWAAFGQRQERLLDRDDAAVVIEHVPASWPSAPVLEFTATSFALLAAVADDARLGRFGAWLSQTDAARAATERLLHDDSASIRTGAIRLIRSMRWKGALAVLFDLLRGEPDAQVQRHILLCVAALEARIPSAIADALLDRADDWLVRLLAFAQHPRSGTVCLLVSDGTAFADDLGALARDAGFVLVTWRLGEFDREPRPLSDDVLTGPALVILVRGEHYARSSNQWLYARLRDFVRGGGTLFATAWATWETQDNDLLADVLPFAIVDRDRRIGAILGRPVPGQVIEDGEVMAHPSADEDAHAWFAAPLRVRGSFEILEPGRCCPPRRERRCSARASGVAA